MEKKTDNNNNNVILTDLDPENITVVENLDLNALFNLSYNFDLLKGIISTILKNQETLKKQIEIERRKNDEQNRSIENLKNSISSIKENYTTNEIFTGAKFQIDNVNKKIDQIHDKISQMVFGIEKSKKKYIFKYYY